tara:strand:- start:52 stop:315 length:264 start_codon:yes stop_codon:yes gene_type:complete
MSKVQKTLINNARLNHLLKLADTYLIKMENGEWSGNPVTYKEIKKSVEHSKSEMAKQSRQRRKTMTIEYIPEIERRGIIGEHNTREV